MKDTTILDDCCKIYTEKIITTLSKNSNFKDINFDNKTYRYYCLLMPGIESYTCNIIDKLLLFVYTDSNTLKPEVTIISDNNYTYDISELYKPLYLSYNNHINVFTIILNLPFNYVKYNKLEEQIYKKLYDLLHHFISVKLMKTDILSNTLRYIFTLLDTDILYDNILLNRIYHVYFNSLYTLDDEINASIYTSLIEGEIAKISKDDYILSLNKNSFSLFYKEFMVTYNTYQHMYKQIDTFLEDLSIFEHIDQPYLNLLYELYPNMNIKEILLYQKAQIAKYMQKLQQAISDQYDKLI